MSQEQLAAAVNVTQPVISGLELHTPRVEKMRVGRYQTLGRIAAVLGVEPEDLMASEAASSAEAAADVEDTPGVS